MNINFIKETFISPYEELLQNVASFNMEKCTFFPQWGSNFPFEEKSGILVVGRACNGWVTNSQDIEVLFGSSENAIFNREDQMRWVEESAGRNDRYNPNRSSFWRVVRNIAKAFYPNNWSSHIAWSNVCKVAPYKGGNPNNKLYYTQLECCQKIFETEIRIFSPKVVILFTGEAWAMDFLIYLNQKQKPVSIEQLEWNKYKSQVYYINGTHFILSEHPQGKKESVHAECIINFIKSITKKLMVSGKNITIGESHRVECSKLTKYKTIISPGR